MSNRWGVSDLRRQAAAKLESFPEKFGDWEMKRAFKLDRDSLNQLQPDGYFQRLYVNRVSGASVGVTVLLGPTGPISVHTPEVCYVGRDHEQVGDRHKIVISEKDGGESAWKTEFRLHGVDGQMQNIFYAWSAGDHWCAAETPRFSFATRPYLYKLQLASRIAADGFRDSADPAIQFLTDFVPVLQDYLQKPATK